jgi:hypothetical protein
MNPLYQQMVGHQNGSMTNGLMEAIAQLKSRISDPNQAIQQLLDSGKVSQEQYNAAVQKAQMLQQLLGGNKL